jgi:Flp pilus assembly protein TadG
MPKWNPFHTFKSRLSQRARQERGQALVEFAVVLPVLLLIILGILYFGRYENYSNAMTQLAEEAARAASVDSGSTSGQALATSIQAQAPPELQAGSSDVTGKAVVYIYYPTGSTYNTVGGSIRVCVVSTVTYPLLLGITSASQTLAEDATMRIEVASSVNLTASNVAAGATPPSQCPTS